MNQIASTNPAKNYQEIERVEVSTPEEIHHKVLQAQKAKQSWKELGVAERTKLLNPLYDEFVQRQDEIAVLITKEVGKPITESRQEVVTYLDYIKWYLDNGEKALADEITYEDEKSI